MGLALKDLIEAKEIGIEELQNRILVVDSFNLLYQFLSTIRQRDGTPLMDSKGRITSHLTGLFTRTANLLQKGVKLAFVFDGKPPELKQKERARRAGLKEEAQKQYEIARDREDIEGMKKYASRVSKLTPQMVDEAKELISAFGCPVVQAPSEGEAQAAHIVRKGDAYAVVSQDFDALLYGTPYLVRNLSIAGRRKKPNSPAYGKVKPEIISLTSNLNRLQIDNDQLIALSILVGTDYDYGGIKGIGPKKALELVKKHGKDFDELFSEADWEKHFDTAWNEIYYLVKQMPVSDDYRLGWASPDIDKIKSILCDEHDFSKERAESILDRFDKGGQKGLSEFM